MTTGYRAAGTERPWLDPVQPRDINVPAAPITGTSGDDHLIGTGGNDTFDLSAGGQDIAEGGKGNDTFIFGGALSAGDRIFGGSGRDMLVLNATTHFTFAAGAMTGVDRIQLTVGAEYDLHFDATTIPSAGLRVYGRMLGDHDNLSVSVIGSTTNSLFVGGGRSEDVLMGGGGNDVLGGGKGYDTLVGGGGADILTGGPDADCYHYLAASDSTGVQFDTVRGFSEADGDMFVVPFQFNDVNPAVGGGPLNGASFDADLATLLDSEMQLGAHDAVLFTPDGGDMAGKTFLIIDFNNVPGYQADGDVVILLDGAASPTHFDDGAFISHIL